MIRSAFVTKWIDIELVCVAEHGIAVGTVGVYLKRGLEAMRRTAQKHPKLLKELEAFLR